MKGEKIYKINHISVNENKTSFCLSYNNGIKLFKTEEFEEEFSINNLGNISFCLLIREVKMIIFSGSDLNSKYNNKTIVVYDLLNNKEIFSTSFLEEIKGIKIISKFLLVTVQSGLKVFSLEKINNLQLMTEIPLLENLIYEGWENRLQEENQTDIITLIHPTDKEINITNYTGNNWSVYKKVDIPNNIGKIQGIFYIPELELAFLVDETAKYIYAIEPKEEKQVMCIYRGNKPGIITSMSLINKNYLVLNNINRTVYIINIKPSGYSLGGLIGKYLYSIDSSIYMTIKYDEIMDKKDCEFFLKDFTEKGSIIWGDSEGSHFYIISYNGFAYRIKINFVKAKMDIVGKKKIADYIINIETKAEENDEKEKESTYKSIFEKEPKKKKEEKEKFISI